MALQSDCSKTDRSSSAHATASVPVVKTRLMIENPSDRISTCTPPIAKRTTHSIQRPSAVRSVQSVVSSFGTEQILPPASFPATLLASTQARSTAEDPRRCRRATDGLSSTSNGRFQQRRWALAAAARHFRRGDHRIAGTANERRRASQCVSTSAAAGSGATQ